MGILPGIERKGEGSPWHDGQPARFHAKTCCRCVSRPSQGRQWRFFLDGSGWMAVISPVLFVWGGPFCLQIVVLFDFVQSLEDSDDMQRDTHTRNDIQIDHDHQVLGDCRWFSYILTTSHNVLSDVGASFQSSGCSSLSKGARHSEVFRWIEPCSEVVWLMVY